MTRNEIQNELKRLGFKKLCDDGKTLTAYNQLQGFLYANKTPMKGVEELYLDEDFCLRAIVYGVDLDIGCNLDIELY